ncbi:MAG: DUF2141 domain-containing protein [Rhodothalassiaceae bacterium]
MLFGLIVLLVLTSLMPCAQAATLTVTVENVPSDDGRLLVYICDEGGYKEQVCKTRSSVPAQPGRITLAIEDVSAGQWGLWVLHDKNDNGKMDFRWFGPPKEAYGNSNNPPPRRGPAYWEDIVFDVVEEDLALSIRLKGAR